MVTEQTKNKDYEERAAILEFDAGMSRAEAELRAKQEIAIREAQKTIEKRRTEYEKKQQQYRSQHEQQLPQIPQNKRERIKAFQEKRDAIGEELRAETDKNRKDELFEQWMELNKQIIQLRKGA